jgi:hypothetical protein
VLWDLWKRMVCVTLNMILVCLDFVFIKKIEPLKIFLFWHLLIICAE